MGTPGDAAAPGGTAPSGGAGLTPEPGQREEEDVTVATVEIHLEGVSPDPRRLSRASKSSSIRARHDDLAI